MSASNVCFATFVLTLVTGLALVWLPLAVLGISGVALVLSIGLARQGRGDEA